MCFLLNILIFHECLLFFRTILGTHIEKRTLLKSPHIYKKHRVQYEVRTHGRLIQVSAGQHKCYKARNLLAMSRAVIEIVSV